MSKSKTTSRHQVGKTLISVINWEKRYINIILISPKKECVTIFLFISQPKHMLWVINTHFQTDG